MAAAHCLERIKKACHCSQPTLISANYSAVSSIFWLDKVSGTIVSWAFLTACIIASGLLYGEYLLGNFFMTFFFFPASVLSKGHKRTEENNAILVLLILFFFF